MRPAVLIGAVGYDEVRRRSNPGAGGNRDRHLDESRRKKAHERTTPRVRAVRSGFDTRGSTDTGATAVDRTQLLTAVWGKHGFDRNETDEAVIANPSGRHGRVSESANRLSLLIGLVRL